VKLVIIKYNAGNILRCPLPLERIGVNAVVTDDAAEISKADKVIFRGLAKQARL